MEQMLPFVYLKKTKILYNNSNLIIEISKGHGIFKFLKKAIFLCIFWDNFWSHQKIIEIPISIMINSKVTSLSPISHQFLKESLKLIFGCFVCHRCQWLCYLCSSGMKVLLLPALFLLMIIMAFSSSISRFHEGNRMLEKGWNRRCHKQVSPKAECDSCSHFHFFSC